MPKNSYGGVVSDMLRRPEEKKRPPVDRGQGDRSPPQGKKRTTWPKDDPIDRSGPPEEKRRNHGHIKKQRGPAPFRGVPEP